MVEGGRNINHKKKKKKKIGVRGGQKVTIKKKSGDEIKKRNLVKEDKHLYFLQQPDLKS